MYQGAVDIETVSNAAFNFAGCGVIEIVLHEQTPVDVSWSKIVQIFLRMSHLQRRKTR